VFRRRKVLSTQAPPGSCQVRSKTESPCRHRAIVEIQGIPFCEGCAWEQEAYFAIGELTQNLCSGPRGKTLGETLDEIRRQRADGLAAARRLDLPSEDETDRLELKESQAELSRELLVPR
jgi:hypothetical protein